MNARLVVLCLAASIVAAASAGCGPEGGAPAVGEKVVLRVGHFPNVTHAQALVAHALSRAGKGWFEERLGPGVEIQWFVYNAGPSAMEALFAKSLDLTYVGPNPALNAHIRSRGEEVRIIAGAALGGSALVVHAEGGLKTAADFKGKKVATPQLGNTQDVACRAWLRAQGFRVTQLGGDVEVLPTANPDQLALFQQKALDAVWTVEPWVTRLEMEAGGKIFLEESDAVTTVLAAGAEFLAERRELTRNFAAAHVELTEWIRSHPEEAQRLAAAELKAETSREITDGGGDLRHHPHRLRPRPPPALRAGAARHGPGHRHHPGDHSYRAPGGQDPVLAARARAAPALGNGEVHAGADLIARRHPRRTARSTPAPSPPPAPGAAPAPSPRR
jgi:NitT/TauT family transport system substrate-binding protein